MDYARLRGFPHDLESYAAHLSRVSPASRPDLFPAREDSLAYWINAYNGLALLLALDHPATPSLRALDSAGGLLPGAAFLTRRFRLGGRWLSLHDIEGRALAFHDRRVHLALNCASMSCPPLSPRAFTPGDLDQELDAATRRFLRDPGNFRLDAAAGTARLSALFAWHERDFRRDLPGDLPLARRIGRQALLTWIEPWLDDAPRDLLLRGGHWTVTFSDWDWSPNAGTLPSAAGAASDRPAGR